MFYPNAECVIWIHTGNSQLIFFQLQWLGMWPSWSFWHCQIKSYKYQYCNWIPFSWLCNSFFSVSLVLHSIHYTNNLSNSSPIKFRATERNSRALFKKYLWPHCYLHYEDIMNDITQSTTKYPCAASWPLLCAVYMWKNSSGCYNTDCTASNVWSVLLRLQHCFNSIVHACQMNSGCHNML